MSLRVFVLVLAVAVGNCAGSPAPREGEIPLIADGAFDPPSLNRVIPFERGVAPMGVGSFDFAANPEEHEFRVSLIVGQTAPTRRWGRCGSVGLDVDGRWHDLPARESGSEHVDWVFDAVGVELTIEHVRAMAAARRVSLSMCGDVVVVPAQALPSLRDFVRRFEEMATYDGPPPPRPPEPLDRNHTRPRRTGVQLYGRPFPV